MLAMDVNDNAGHQAARVAHASIASKLAPTGGMRWRHGFNEFFSIVRCLHDLRMNPSAQLTPRKYGTLSRSGRADATVATNLIIYKNKGSP
ncbi:hypothetical protein CES87_06610 [Pseudomonas sp. ERMR1:02]|nr:hypothetical protein CES87_06610 [Pseudomonas sp. ERMR1:02]